MTIKKALYSLLVLILATTFTADFALAQKAGKKKEEDQANAIDAGTGTILQKAQEFINQKQLAQARAKLGELKPDKLSPHEKAIVEQFFVQMDIEEEKYASARQHMQAAIDSGGLSDKEILDGKYMIAQTFVQEEKYAEGAKGIEDWMKSAPKISGANYYLLAICYFQLEKPDQALINAKKAVDASDKPQTAWIELYGSLLIQKERYKEALPVLERLVNAVPNKKSYWYQLSGIYGQLDDYKNALIVMQLANDAGLWTEGAELQRIADLMMTQDMPYSAATVVAKAIEDKKIQPDAKANKFMGDAYVAAREYKKALPLLEKAAQSADNGNEFVRIGQVNMQISQWDAAISAFEKALSKGVKDKDDAQFNIGASYFYMKKYAEAKAAFEKVSPNTQAGKNSKSFINNINQQLKTR